MGSCLCVGGSTSGLPRVEEPSNSRSLIAAVVTVLALALFLSGILAFAGVGALSSVGDGGAAAMMVSGALVLALAAIIYCSSSSKRESAAQREKSTERDGKKKVELAREVPRAEVVDILPVANDVRRLAHFLREGEFIFYQGDRYEGDQKMIRMLDREFPASYNFAAARRELTIGELRSRAGIG